MNTAISFATTTTWQKIPLERPQVRTREGQEMELESRSNRLFAWNRAIRHRP